MSPCFFLPVLRVVTVLFFKCIDTILRHFRKLEHAVIFSQLITPGMTPKSSDIEFWTIKYQKGNGPPPPPNPNYAPKTRLAEVFKTNPVISLFDCQASHEHADDLWACHANPLHRGRIITTRHTRRPLAKRESHDKPWETVLRSLLKYNTIGAREK